jgi:hypothetical protein
LQRLRDEWATIAGPELSAACEPFMFSGAKARRLVVTITAREISPPWGIRGVDSLATAMAVPFVIGDRTPFPCRNLVIFLSFGVILATLVLQGFTLPMLIRWLKLRDDGLDEEEEMRGRSVAAEAALRRLNELAQEPRGARRYGRETSRDVHQPAQALSVPPARYRQRAGL